MPIVTCFAGFLRHVSTHNRCPSMVSYLDSGFPEAYEVSKKKAGAPSRNPNMLESFSFGHPKVNPSLGTTRSPTAARRSGA